MAISLALFLGMAFLLLSTPTLNYDDLGYPSLARRAIDEGGLYGFGRLILTALLNADIGTSELRTYGLARAIQLTTAALFGRAPLPIYALITAVHCASGIIVFKLIRQISGDGLIAAFAAVTWVASPAVLTLLKCEHHLLYLVAPLYPLMLWLHLAMKERLSAWVGIPLLTLSWFLGEVAIISMSAAILWATCCRRDRQLLLQGVCAFALLATYLVSQKIFFNDPDHAQRFLYVGPRWIALTTTISELWESGKAVVGQRYLDGELQNYAGLVGPFKTSLTLLGAAVVFAFSFAASMKTPLSTKAVDWRTGVIFAAFCPLSVLLYAALSTFYATGLAVRYTAGFYALLPLSVITILALVIPTRLARILAGALAACSLAMSLGLLYRAEVLVSRPNRVTFAQMRPGTAIVVHHSGWTVTPDGHVDGDYPGLISPFQNGLANPLREAWTTSPALKLYSGVTFGTTCRQLQDGRIAVYYEGSEATFASADVTGRGLADRNSFDVRELSIEELCRP